MEKYKLNEEKWQYKISTFKNYHGKCMQKMKNVSSDINDRLWSIEELVTRLKASSKPTTTTKKEKNG
jgi:hypothetical protein